MKYCRNVSIVISLGVVFLMATKYVSGTTVQADDSRIQYSGRINFENPKEPVFYWPGTSVTANFQGTSIKPIMKDSGKNYFNIIIDNNKPFVLACDRGKRTYEVAKGLSEGSHKIEIFKRTENGEGDTVFYGFVLDAGKTLLSPPSKPARRIEFYGDSVTSGLAIESDKDDQTPPFKNNYLAYGAVTARNLNAEYHCISMSGIGLMISYWPGIMPQYYDRLNPAEPNSKWDFKRWVPDVVVVNIMHNDAALLYKLDPVPTHQQIVETYVAFIKNIRKEYPQSHIICALLDGVIENGQEWRTYIEEAVDVLKTTYNDRKVYSIALPCSAKDRHPNVAEHAKMAENLTAFIKAKVGW